MVAARRKDGLHPAFLIYTLLSLVDFLHLLLCCFADIIAECSHTVGMILAHKVTISTAHFLIRGRWRDAQHFVSVLD